MSQDQLFDQIETPPSLAEIAFQAIKKAILEKHLVPNKIYNEKVLADELGFSKTPVHEALTVLCVKGFVTMLPRKGFQVRAFSAKNIQDMYEFRTTLERAVLEKIVPDKTKTIREGAVIPWQNYFSKPEAENGSWGFMRLKAMASQWGIDMDVPWTRLPKKHKDLILKGSNGMEMVVNWRSEKIQGEFTTTHEGLLNSLMRRYKQTRSESMKKWYARSG